jgi:hypothetical protein
MKAERLIRERVVFPDGALVEMVAWRVPEAVPPTRHGYKYSLVYVEGGVRVLGYDNERGKGDHRHVLGVEEPVTFETLEALVARFVAEVEELRRLR